MICGKAVKFALWGLAGALLCALPANANLFVVAGGGKNYKNVVVVAESGGHYTSVQAALDSISGASDSNRYLIFVAPGTYTGRFTMEPYVDIAGSGPNVTILQAAGGASLTAASATGVGADNATLSDLTVKNTGGAANGIAMLNSSAGTTLWRVYLEASGATYNYGLVNAGGSPQIKECHIIAQGSGTNTNYGVYNSVASPTFQNCDIGAYNGSTAYASWSEGGLVTFQDCRLGAEGATSVNQGAHNRGLGADAKFYHCQISANADGTSANQTGVYNTYGTHVKMYECQVESREGSSAYGIKCDISGGSQIDKLYANRCSIRAQSASGAKVGVYSAGDTTPVVEVYLNHCDIQGETYTVQNVTHVHTFLGACWLNGGATVAGTTEATMTCAGCYDENYTFSASTCP